MNGLAVESAHVDFQAVHFDLRFRAHGAEEGLASDQLVESRGRRVGLETNDSPDQAVCQLDLFPVCAGGGFRDKRIGVDQPIVAGGVAGGAENQVSEQQD